LPQDDLGFTVVNGKGGRRLQSLVWDMDKNATDDFQCAWPEEMKLDSCIQPLPLVVKHEQQVTCSMFPYLVALLCVLPSDFQTCHLPGACTARTPAELPACRMLFMVSTLQFACHSTRVPPESLSKRY